MKELKSNEVDQGLKGRSRRGRNGGFSLVEFMVGSGVMTLVLAGCFSGIGQAIVISENVESSNFATQILQSEIDEIHTMQWSEIEQLSNQGAFNLVIPRSLLRGADFYRKEDGREGGKRRNENSPQQAAGYLTLSPIGP